MYDPDVLSLLLLAYVAAAAAAAARAMIISEILRAILLRSMRRDRQIDCFRIKGSKLAGGGVG